MKNEIKKTETETQEEEKYIGLKVFVALSILFIIVQIVITFAERVGQPIVSDKTENILYVIGLSLGCIVLIISIAFEDVFRVKEWTDEKEEN